MKKIITICLLLLSFTTLHAQTKYEFNLCDSSYRFDMDTLSKVFYQSDKTIYSYNSINKKNAQISSYFSNSNWTNSSMDSFDYYLNGKLKSQISFYWDQSKNSFKRNQLSSFFYNSYDSMNLMIGYVADTNGVFDFSCPFNTRNSLYSPTTNLKIEDYDSSSLGFTGNCTMSFDQRDSLVYDNNKNLIEFYKNYPGNSITYFNYKILYTYSSVNNLIFERQELLYDTTFGAGWKKMLKYSYHYFNDKIIMCDSFWDWNLGVWDSNNSSYYVFYKPSYDRFGNVISEKEEFWNLGKFTSSDSTHYYYHIPACLSYYTTDYDTLTNSFNLTLDSITNTQAVAYHWNFGDGSTSNLQYPSHTYLVDTTYNVCLTIYKSNGDSCTYCHIIGKDYQGHIIKSAGFNLNVNGQGNIGVNEIVNEKPELVVFPNPVSNQLTVYSKQFAVNKVEIKNILGQVIEGNSPLQRGLGGFEINVYNLPTGVYFLKATDEKGNSYNAKFVKQ